MANLTDDERSSLNHMNPPAGRANIGNRLPIAVGSELLDAGTGVANNVVLADVVATDLVFVSLLSDDTVPITSLFATANAGSIDITQVSGTSDNAVCNYVVFRP